MAQGRRAPTAAAAARCTSPIPTLGIFGANGIVAAGLPIAVGAATAAQLRARRQRRGRVLRRRRGRAGRVPRGGEPRRGVAAAGVFFCENNGYAEFSPAVDAARGAARAAGRGLRRRATSRSTATTSSRPPTAMQRRWSTASAPGGGPVIVEATTYRWHGHYEGDPRALPHARRAAGVGGARPARRPRAPAPRRPASTTTRSTALRASVAQRARRRGRRGPRAGRSPAVDDADRLRRPPAARAPRAARARRRRAGVPHDGRDPRPRSRPSSPTDERVFVAGIDVGAGGNVFGLTRGLHDRFGDRVRDTPISETRDRGPRRRRGDGGHAPGRRADVPRLRRRVPRPAAQPGGQAAVHDRRRRADGADRAHAVRRRPLVGQPALAEPRGAARAHPRADRRDAVDAGRHLRPAARRDPGPEPGGVHREPAALRHEGPAAAGRPPRPDRHGPPSCAPGTDVTVVSVSRMVHEARRRGRAASPARASRSR